MSWWNSLILDCDSPFCLAPSEENQTFSVCFGGIPHAGKSDFSEQSQGYLVGQSWASPAGTTLLSIKNKFFMFGQQILSKELSAALLWSCFYPKILKSAGSLPRLPSSHLIGQGNWSLWRWWCEHGWSLLWCKNSSQNAQTPPWRHFAPFSGLKIPWLAEK